MFRKLFPCFLLLLATSAVYAEGISLSISLPKESFNRGRNVPVEGLTVSLTISNPSKVVVMVPKPVIHPEAAPGMAARAVIKRTDGAEGEDSPMIPISGMAPPFAVTNVETLRIEPMSEVTLDLDVGPFYLIRKPGAYEMSIVYRDVESNTVSFTVLPVRRVPVPAKTILQKMEDIEWGNPDYMEMFYIAPSRRAWDEIVLVQRIRDNMAYSLVATGVGFLPPDEMPEMVILSPRVYGMLYREKTGRDWVVAKFDCSKDPFTSEYRHVKGEEKPDMNSALAEMR